MQEFPTRQDLDAICPDRPVCISHFTMHTTWCNTRALELAGITAATPDPEGGTIVRDAAGEPTGVLLEHPASCLVADLALDIPDLPTSIRKRLASFAELGITAVGDMFPRDITNKDVYETYKRFEDAGELTCRITFFPSLLDLDQVIAMRETYASDMLRVGGVKQIMDGIVEAHTAWMQESYLGDEPHYGAPILPPDEFKALVARADAAGVPVRVHAIGDATAHLVVEAHTQAQAANGHKGTRHVIEHAESIRDEDIAEAVRLGVCASVQPLHATFGTVTGLYQEALGDERAAACWRFRTMLDAGMHVGVSTDFPACATNEPMQVIYAAVTRCMPDGFPEGGFNPQYAFTLGEVLQGYTAGSAYVEGNESRFGTLEAGKLADIIVLDRNLFACVNPAEIQEARVERTILGGKTIFSA